MGMIKDPEQSQSESPANSAYWNDCSSQDYENVIGGGKIMASIVTLYRG